MEGKFFTTIQDPKEFRRNLLMGSKDVISVLKEYQKLTDLRDMKKEIISDLQRQFEELNVLMGKLESYLPEESIKQLESIEPKPESKKTPAKKKKTSKKKSTKKTSTKSNSKSKSASKAKSEPETKEEPAETLDPEVAKLEKALANIEEKLEKV